VAADETRHGQLAWDLHAWFMSQLSEADQARVTAAQQAAFVRLQDVAAAEASVPALGRLKRDDAMRLATVFAEKLSA
jgi:hypothetical protein